MYKNVFFHVKSYLNTCFYSVNNHACRHRLFSLLLPHHILWSMKCDSLHMFDGFILFNAEFSCGA